MQCFQLLSWAQSIPEATAGCLGSLPVPVLAGRAGSLLEAAVGWIQPIDSTTWAFYSTLPPLCLPSASSWGRLQTFNLGKLPLQDGAGMALGPSAQSHMHQLQQELTRTECAVPALLPSNPQPTALSPQGRMFLQHQDMGCLLQTNRGFSLSLPRGHNGVQSCISALRSNVSGRHWKGINPVPPSMHGLSPPFF